MKNFIRKAYAFIFSICLLVPAFALGNKEDAGVFTDRAGNQIELPTKIEKIAVFAPSTFKIVDGLGLKNKVIAVDTYSAGKDASLKELPAFDMMKPDTEKIIALNPDLIFTTGMSKAGGKDPFKPVREAGICVLDIPTSTSFDAIYEDIEFIASALGVRQKGVKMANGIKKEIEKYKKIANTIPAEKRKTVYVEIGAPPYLYSTGKNTYMNEALEIIGAKNIFADQEGWISISEEQVLAKNPDIILTQVDYIDQPVENVKTREGWNVIKAVKNNNVYLINADYLAQPCQHIVKGVEEIAKFIYPEYFK